MIGPILLVFGLASGLAGWALLRAGGPAWRVGRLLTAAPQRTMAEAARLAAEGQPAYIRLHGRVDSDEEFPSDEGLPLVYRRRRLQRRLARGSWSTFDDERLAVPFRLREKGEHVVIEAAALGDGLVVVPRESVGVAADLTPEAVSGPLPDLPPDTPVRLRIEQISAADHATAAGVPRLDEGGSLLLGPGLGRPLVLTTLELDEAMRVLGTERRTPILVGGALLLLAVVLVVLGLLLVALGW